MFFVQRFVLLCQIKVQSVHPLNFKRRKTRQTGAFDTGFFLVFPDSRGRTVRQQKQTRNRAWSHEILSSAEGRKETFVIMAQRRSYILVVWFAALFLNVLHYFSVAMMATRRGTAQVVLHEDRPHDYSHRGRTAVHSKID